jgi:hypothetical protein
MKHGLAFLEYGIQSMLSRSNLCVAAARRIDSDIKFRVCIAPRNKITNPNPA